MGIYHADMSNELHAPEELKVAGDRDYYTCCACGTIYGDFDECWRCGSTDIVDDADDVYELVDTVPLPDRDTAWARRAGAVGYSDDWYIIDENKPVSGAVYGPVGEDIRAGDMVEFGADGCWRPVGSSVGHVTKVNEDGTVWAWVKSLPLDAAIQRCNDDIAKSLAVEFIKLGYASGEAKKGMARLGITEGHVRSAFGMWKAKRELLAVEAKATEQAFIDQRAIDSELKRRLVPSAYEAWQEERAQLDAQQEQQCCTCSYHQRRDNTPALNTSSSCPIHAGAKGRPD